MMFTVRTSELVDYWIIFVVFLTLKFCFITLQSTGLVHLALWSRNATSVPRPSSSCDKFSVPGRQLILLNAVRCSVVVLHPAPYVLRTEFVLNLNISSVSFWNRIHLFQSAVRHFVPNVPGSLGSTTLNSLTIVRQCTMLLYNYTISWNHQQGMLATTIVMWESTTNFIKQFQFS